jgi:hypothetical protein
MALAIYLDANLRADSATKFQTAIDIAKARCAQYGLLEGDTLTAKGRQSEAKHSQEGGHKSARFDFFYAKFVEVPEQRKDKGAEKVATRVLKADAKAEERFLKKNRVR